MMWLGEQGDDDETVYHKDSYDEQSDDISETASDPQPMWRPGKIIINVFVFYNSR